MNWKIRRLTLDLMIRSNAYDHWISDRLGNDLFTSDPDRASRCYDGSILGYDGSTHAEIIEDWRDYLAEQDLPVQVRNRIGKEIDECEEWHRNNQTLEEVVG